MWDRLADALNRGAFRPALGYALIVGAIAATAALLTCGCGASAISQHARAAIVVTHAHLVAGEVADAARTAELDRAEAEHPTDPEHDLAVTAVAERWRPVGLALDAAAEALRTWVASLELARAAGGDSWLGEALAVAIRVLALYSQAVAVAADLGTELPALPASVTSLLGAAQGGQ